MSDETCELFLEIEKVVRSYYRPEIDSRFPEQKSGGTRNPRK